jgi:hypothetical protein
MHHAWVRFATTSDPDWTPTTSPTATPCTSARPGSSAGRHSLRRSDRSDFGLCGTTRTRLSGPHPRHLVAGALPGRDRARGRTAGAVVRPTRETGVVPDCYAGRRARRRHSRP